MHSSYRLMAEKFKIIKGDNINCGAESVWGHMWGLSLSQRNFKHFRGYSSTTICLFLVKVCLTGPEQDIFYTCTNICFPRRTNLVSHSLAQTLAHKLATAFLANNWGKGWCTDGSELRHTRTSLPAYGPLLHWLLSDLTGHICYRTKQRLDFRSMREPVTDLKDTFSNLLCH